MSITVLVMINHASIQPQTFCFSLIPACKYTTCSGSYHIGQGSEFITEFKERYNHHRRLEKLAFMSTLEARQAYAMRKAA